MSTSEMFSLFFSKNERKEIRRSKQTSATYLETDNDLQDEQSGFLLGDRARNNRSGRQWVGGGSRFHVCGLRQHRYCERETFVFSYKNIRTANQGKRINILKSSCTTLPDMNIAVSARGHVKSRRFQQK